MMVRCLLRGLDPIGSFVVFNILVWFILYLLFIFLCDFFVGSCGDNYRSIDYELVVEITKFIIISF